MRVMHNDHGGGGQWPPAARAMARGIVSAAGAAHEGDGDAFEHATGELARSDREQLGALVGDVTRALIERAHPDGLDSADAEELLRNCVRTAVPWYRPLDTDALIRALTGALGIGDTGAVGVRPPAGTDVDDGDEADEPAPDPEAVLAHGLLLVAELSGAHPGQLDGVLDEALGELMRAQTMELP